LYLQAVPFSFFTAPARRNLPKHRRSARIPEVAVVVTADQSVAPQVTAEITNFDYFCSVTSADLW